MNRSAPFAGRTSAKTGTTVSNSQTPLSTADVTRKTYWAGPRSPTMMWLPTDVGSHGLRSNPPTMLAVEIAIWVTAAGLALFQRMLAAPGAAITVDVEKN